MFVLVCLWAFQFIFFSSHYHPGTTHSHTDQVGDHQHSGRYHSAALEVYAHLVNGHFSNQELDNHFHHSHSSEENDENDSAFFVLAKYSKPPKADSYCALGLPQVTDKLLRAGFWNINSLAVV